MERTIEKTIEGGEGYGTRYFRHSAGRRFCHPHWCGVFMIVAGLLWLAGRLGWISGELFWPLLLIIVGSVITLSYLVRRGKSENGQSIYPGSKAP